MTGVKHLFSSLYRFPRDAAPTITLGDNSTIHAAGWGILEYIVSAVLLYLFLNYTQPPFLVFLVTFNTPIAPFMPRITKPSLPTLTTPAPSPSLPSFILQ